MQVLVISYSSIDNTLKSQFQAKECTSHTIIDGESYSLLMPLKDNADADQANKIQVEPMLSQHYQELIKETICPLQQEGHHAAMTRFY